MPGFDCASDPNSARVECAICLAPWAEATELRPCGHIFCKACVGDLPLCPECRAAVEGKGTPNRLLLNIVSALTGKCVDCGWSGTKEEFEQSHSKRCTGSPPPRPAARPAEVDLGDVFGVPPARPQPAEPPRPAPQDPFAPVTHPLQGRTPAAAAALDDSDREFERQMQLALTLSMRENHSPTGGALPSNDFEAIADSTVRSRAPPPPQPPAPPATDNSLINALHARTAAQQPPQQRAPTAGRAFVEDEDDAPWTDYGMTEAEYTKALHFFMALADDSGKMHRESLRRFLMIVNLPCHDSVIDALFAMFGEDPKAGAVTFHQLCVWAPSHRRDSKKEYNLSPEVLELIMADYLEIDSARKGYLTDDEAQMLLAVMRTNKVTTATWAALKEPLVRQRAHDPKYPPGVLLHDLLTLCASASDGWDVCDVVESPNMPVGTPTASTTAAQASRPQAQPQPQQQQQRRPHSQTVPPSQAPPPQQPLQYPYQQQQAPPPVAYGPPPAAGPQGGYSRGPQQPVLFNGQYYAPSQLPVNYQYYPQYAGGAPGYPPSQPQQQYSSAYPGVPGYATAYPPPPPQQQSPHSMLQQQSYAGQYGGPQPGYPPQPSVAGSQTRSRRSQSCAHQ